MTVFRIKIRRKTLSFRYFYWENQISMYKSFHVIFCHPMDHYKFMRNIKQHLSLLLDEPAEKQMIRNLPHRFSSLFYSFSLSRFSISLAISLIPTRTQIYVISFFAVSNCSLNMYNKDERVMLGVYA